MKFSPAWGNGRRVGRGNRFSLLRNRPRSGGSGTVVIRSDLGGNYVLKFVGFRKKDGGFNDMFWGEAQSVSLYTSIPQNVPGCVRCPLPVTYWIREDDPLYLAFLRSGKCVPSPRLLVDFISIFGIEPEQLADIGIDDPAAYRLAPPPLLEEIRGAAEKKAPEQLPDLLLAYPIQQSRNSLSEWSESRFANNPSTVLRMVSHILSAILTLYRKGLAHGDVKPANIMMFPCCLTDIGSLGAGNKPSDSLSEEFFDRNTFKLWRRERDKKKQNRELIGKGGFEPDTPCSDEDLNRLLRRTLMDGYALAATIWSLAAGRTPKPEAYLNPDVIDEKWHCDELTTIFDTLYRVNDLTIGTMQKIADRLREKFPYRDVPAPPLQTYGKEAEIGFDVEWIEKIDDKTEIEYGKLSEQLPLGGKSNPVLRLRGKVSSSLPDEIVMQPVIQAYSSGNKLVSSIFYAPDDAVTGSRAVDFKKYQPCTLAYLLDHGKLTEKDIGRITALGRLVDEVEKDFSSRDHNYHLPYPHDIVKIGGDWMIMPFFMSSMRYGCPMSFEEYFKMLCGKKNELSAQNWADLLAFDHGVGILFELLPEEMIPRIVELLNDADSVDPESLSDWNERWKIGRLRWMRRELLKRKVERFGRYLRPERDRLF